ncbi:MAG: hypothetical protein ACOC4C_02440 [Fibrobacterota bacterium]
MALSYEEIVEYAKRYVDEQQLKEFPIDGDLFCLFSRQIPSDKMLEEEEGWSFGGYGIALKYELDLSAKPAGKWIWFHFISLASFPPVQQVIKLQPPHIVKGRFFSPDRTLETRIMRIPWQDALKNETSKEVAAIQPDEENKTQPQNTPENKVLKFTRKKV